MRLKTKAAGRHTQARCACAAAAAAARSCSHKERERTARILCVRGNSTLLLLLLLRSGRQRPKCTLACVCLPARLPASQPASLLVPACLPSFSCLSGRTRAPGLLSPLAHTHTHTLLCLPATPPRLLVSRLPACLLASQPD